MFLHVDSIKGLNILLCQVLLTMRRHEEIIKNVVLESPLLLHFLGEQKMKDQASAEHKSS